MSPEFATHKDIANWLLPVFLLSSFSTNLFDRSHQAQAPIKSFYTYTRYSLQHKQKHCRQVRARYYKKKSVTEGCPASHESNSDS
jgi:hypothetical protein